MRSKTSPQKATFESAWKLIQENAKAIKEMKVERKKEAAERKEEVKRAEKERKEWKASMKESSAKSDKEWKEFRASMKAMQKEMGGISNSNGDVAESYFINSFERSMQFAGQRYDNIDSNVRRKNRQLRLQGEYDIVLYNCSSVAIIEIKYKAKKEDVEPLLNKAQTFKQLFPEYAHYDLYVGLAGMHVNITAEREAIKQGVAVIKQVGDNMVINDAHLKTF